MEFINDHQEHVIINVLTCIVNGETPVVDSEDKQTIREFIDLINKEREWERWSVHCNTDCLLYRNGMCPYKWNEHYKCPEYKDMKD